MISETLLSPALTASAPAVIPCLAMRLPQAAQAISVSPRTLWEWTQRGGVPHVRRGKTILYPVDALRRWLDAQSQLNKQTQGGSNDTAHNDDIR